MWYITILILGYWFLDSPEHNWTPPASLLSFIEEGPTIYIGFGSIVVPDPEEMTKIIVDAVVQAKVRVILSKGWSGRLSKKDEVIEYPPCIYPLEKVPHDWLFPKMAGVVHHGGAGTTAAGLRAGVPTLIRPFFGDQFFWADRVQDLGVGFALKKFSTKALASALVALKNPKIKEMAVLLGDKIRSEDGVSKAIQYVYRDMLLAQQKINLLPKFE